MRLTAAYCTPDCRSMATSGRGSGMVAYNVQSAVDTTNHLIVAHEVTNVRTNDIPAVVEAMRQYWMPIRYARAG
jgi:hypothetical protein